ncbi:MAG TPA: carbohydrate ABC transporter permease [Anaerolineae bacterium]|nr:carbohydrate ABC transporter permease [Anaerolineae bacterium]HQI85596.1 carbohydrate ABC transporter permease [Anaerolineae bacterium]
MNQKIVKLPFFENLVNLAVLALLALLCAFPIVHTLALSFSSAPAASSGRVTLWPVEFTTQAYRFVLENPAFIRSFGVSLLRVLVGVPVNMLLTILVAYPLSRSKAEFRARDFFAWFFLLTVLFSGGLIPWYMVIRQTGLIDNFWALILPGALPVFNVILLANSFRSIPKELEEAAAMDGAGHWTILFRVLLPLSLPILATLTLFVAVAHWNAWFDGLILMNSPDKYPLQSYLQTVVINPDPRMLTERDLALLQLISNRTTRAAQIFIAMVPILLVYPFLQRYFTAGVKLGSVKG